MRSTFAPVETSSRERSSAQGAQVNSHPVEPAPTLIGDFVTALLLAQNICITERSPDRDPSASGQMPIARAGEMQPSRLAILGRRPHGRWIREQRERLEQAGDACIAQRVIPVTPLAFELE